MVVAVNVSCTGTRIVFCLLSIFDYFFLKNRGGGGVGCRTVSVVPFHCLRVLGMPTPVKEWALF